MKHYLAELPTKSPVLNLISLLVDAVSKVVNKYGPQTRPALVSVPTVRPGVKRARSPPPTSGDPTQSVGGVEERLHNMESYLKVKSGILHWILAKYRVAQKNGTGYFPQYVDAIIGISVWANFSWEKWYQDQQFWFSSLFSRAHFVRQCRGPKFSLFSLDYGWKQYHFGSP